MAARGRSPLLPAHDPIDHEIRPETRAKLALERVRVVLPLDPFEESDPLRLALQPVALEEGVEDARLGEAEVAVAQGKLPHRLIRWTALVDHQVERGEEAHAVGARLAVQHRR